MAISINGKKGSRLKDIKDFLFDWDTSKPKGTQSVEDIKRIFESLGARSKEEKVNKRDNKRIPRAIQKRLEKEGK